MDGAAQVVGRGGVGRASTIGMALGETCPDIFNGAGPWQRGAHRPCMIAAVTPSCRLFCRFSLLTSFLSQDMILNTFLLFHFFFLGVSGASSCVNMFAQPNLSYLYDDDGGDVLSYERVGQSRSSIFAATSTLRASRFLLCGT